MATDPGASKSPRMWEPGALALAAFMGSAGVGHFVSPQFFEPLVPQWMPGSARTTVYVSGVVELVAAALLTVPKTRRFGGWFTAATLVGVFPANVQAAVDGGMADMAPPFDSAAVAWARLPLQIPMVAAAMWVARRRPSAD